MPEKLYLDAQHLLEDSCELAARVLASGYAPSFIVAVWRGGTPIGIAVQEFLAWHGVESDHVAIRTASYEAIDRQASTVKVYNLGYLVKKITAEDRLLIVDDVFDSGASIAAIIDTLARQTRRNMPREVRIAVPYYKPARNRSGRVPDYYLHETDQWIKFPHSLEGLSPEEIREHRPELAAILATYQD